MTQPSNREQHPLWLLQLFFDPYQKSDRLLAVHHPVIIGQGHVHHGTNLDVIFHHNGPFLDLMEAFFPLMGVFLRGGTDVKGLSLFFTIIT